MERSRGVGGETAFAVLDLETTGFGYRKNDRIVEVGVVQLDAEGNIERRWSTLVHPGRDVGPTNLHGITAADVVGAPTFADVAYELQDLLLGRVLVAHNAAFDINFLGAEFARAGVDHGVHLECALCTMHLAGQVLDVRTRSLASCCDAVGVSNARAHSALADAEATAGLLRAILSHETSQHMVAGLRPVPGSPRARTAAARLQQRGQSNERGSSWLTRVAASSPGDIGPPEQAEYLALLDTALVDRELSLLERDSFVDLANDLGMSRAEVLVAHEDYVAALAAQAWDDGVVTDEERDDLLLVADRLDVPASAVDELLAGPVAGGGRAVEVFALSAGDRITLTGDMVAPKSEWARRAESRGLIVAASVAKSNRLVVAADPDSSSGNARKARQYRIPIVGEAWFGRALEAMGPRG